MTPLVFFCVYLAAVVGIGLLAASKGKSNESDYFLGGRSFSPLVTALSAVSSGRSAWLMMGAAVVAYKTGFSALWYFPGYIVVECLMFLTMGRRLRVRSAEVDAITVPEFLGRCGRPETARTVQRVAALVTVLFLITYIGAQLLAGGKALSHVVQIGGEPIQGETWGVVITAGIVLFYTFFGGYRAVAFTDVLQSLFMLVGLTLLPVLAVHHAGGWDAMVQALRQLDPSLLNWNRGFWPLVSGLAIGLGSLGNPHILVRYMSIRDPKQLTQSAWIGTGWNIVMAGGALVLGLAGRALYPTASHFPATAQHPGGDMDLLFPTLAQTLSEQYLFAGFAGLLLATLFAAIMSTCDSQLLVVASSLVRDLFARDEKKASSESANEEGGLLQSRLAVLAAVAVAVWLGFGSGTVIDTFVLASWGALGAAFGPVLLCLLYGRTPRPRALIAGILVGALVSTLWSQAPLVTNDEGLRVTLKALTSVYELVPAFLASFAAILVLR